MTGTSWPDESRAPETTAESGSGGSAPSVAGPEGARAFPGSTGNRLTVLSGPSGVGKSTVVAELRRAHPEVWLSVSVTTRRPRPGETHGVEYFFADDEEFDRLAASGELLE